MHAAAPARIERAENSAASPLRWRGFNLQNMFWKGWKEGRFSDYDFRLIQALGFNFVRLPLDYRIWTADPEKLAWIDEAVALGEKYAIHVCLNLHRAPGYTVDGDEAEPGDLWTDIALQDAFVAQWKNFATRYQGISATRLSFNLVNEPTGASEEVIAAILERAARAIWKISPDRPVVVDGLDWGTRPLKTLANLPLIQATRGYQPRDVVRNTDNRPPAAWPQVRLNAYLYGDGKPALQSPLRLFGSFPRGKVRIAVEEVAVGADLEISADNIFLAAKHFEAGLVGGAWSEFQIGPAAKELKLQLRKGDWLRFRSIEFVPDVLTQDQTILRLPATDFKDGLRQGELYLDPTGVDVARSPMFDRAWLLDTQMPPWLALQKNGVQVFVGEAGAPKSSPHAVYLAWLEDNLANWKAAGWGWALWDFRGEFGIFDSQRTDVNYEDFEGAKLDRGLLKLLQRY